MKNKQEEENKTSKNACLNKGKFMGWPENGIPNPCPHCGAKPVQDGYLRIYADQGGGNWSWVHP